MFCLPQSYIVKVLAKSFFFLKDKEKEAAIYQNIASLDALLDHEGWKVSPLKGMYATRLPTLIEVI